MEKERLIALLSADRLSAEDLDGIKQLASEYPWFNLAHFLKLKALKHLGHEQEEALGKAAVFSSDRRHLYHWISSQVDLSTSSVGLTHRELEFIGDDAFELDTNEDLDMEGMKGVAVKEDMDMEEPDVEEPVAFPALDLLMEKEEEDQSVMADKEEELIPIKEEELTPIFDTSPLLKDIIEAPNTGRKNESPNLIEQFINNEPGVIKADKPTTLTGDVAARSVKESDSFITDTLAQIYVKQGLFAKAIYAYERLSLKYPEKSAYFAAQIEKIKNISNS